MSEEYDAPTRVIREIVLRAASGHQDQALRELLELTESEDPPLAWMATAAALPGMYWRGAIGEASVLVQRIVERFGATTEQHKLSGHVGFEVAVAAGAAYAGEDGIPRLFAMAGHLPASCALRDRLLWSADYMAEHGAAALMPLNLCEPTPLRDYDAGLLSRGVAALDNKQIRRLWQHAAARSRADVLVMLRDAGQVIPLSSPVMYALAESLLIAGREEEAEQVMLDARSAWYPLAIWDTLPITPPLNPGLRPLVTARVVEAYFTSPLGEMLPG